MPFAALCDAAAAQVIEDHTVIVSLGLHVVRAPPAADTDWRAARDLRAIVVTNQRRRV